MKTFCCIIPARLGVLTLAPLTGVTAGLCSFFSLFALIAYFDDLVLGQKVFLGLLGGSMAILTLASIFGFIGALIESLSAISFYSSVLSTIWLSIVLTGIINFIFMYKDKTYFVKSCTANRQDESMLDTLDLAEKWCNDKFILGFSLMVAFWGVVALFSLYLISIVRRYGRQLAEEHHH